MAELPSATTIIDDEAGAFAGGTGYAIVVAAVARNADITPRVFASTKGLLDQHGYSDGAEYTGSHIEKSKKPVIFVGLPIATAGVAGQFDSTGVAGTSRMYLSAGSDGYLAQCDGIFTVTKGGTVGTDQIAGILSLDGGRINKPVRIGTSSSYAIPYVGVVLNFGAGTLIAGDVFKFRTSAPMWDTDGLAAARTALAAQLKLARSWVIVGDLPDSDFADAVTTATNAYETSNDRFVYARVSVRDYNPSYAPRMSRVKKSMTGAPTLTFAEVGATGDTITRSAGSWITDGFAIGDIITVAGSVSNNVTGIIANLDATVITLDTTDLVAEGPVAGCTVVASASLTFAEVGATGDTITRSAGSWTDDGFAVGDEVEIDGTASNDGTYTIASLSATVITLGSEDLAAEVIGSRLVTVTKVQTMADYVAEQDAEFDGVDDQKRIDLSIGRARKISSITGWKFRRPAAWAASIREYEERLDVHMPTWAKEDGPLDGWDLEDADGNVVEYDERVHGGGLAARFTCLRTWGNGPKGAFVALSLTRAPEGSLLSRTHNLAVANLACTVTQAATELIIGKVLVLNDDGTATSASLSVIESRVNSALELALLQDRGKGPRASKAVWTASRTDVLSVPEAELTGSVELVLNGTVEKVSTRVRVVTGG